MPRTRVQPVADQVSVTQHTIDDLLTQLTNQEGSAIEWPVQPEDIGSGLLAILSKGLYTNPLDAIREYVQNGVDARASMIKIKITGRSVVIRDNGEGMDIGELVQARQFGLSYKRPDEHVGFRGIGIYSGFDLCNRLVITTKKSGENFYYVLTFAFGEMRALLETERKDSNRPRTPLVTLLTKYSSFTRYNIEHKSRDLTRSYTIVQLEELSEEHIAQVADRNRIRDYILRNLPIDFEPSFAYRDQIIAELNQRLGGYHPVRIELIFDGPGNTEIVSRPNIDGLLPPKTGIIRNSKNDPIAFYWACRTQGSSRIENKEFAGFVYKVKGFTIGDNYRLHRFFKKGNAGLYWWYTGEIYVLDTNVIPNAARDDFETNPAKEQLVIAVERTMRELDDEAEEARAQNRADRTFLEAGAKFADIAKKVSSGRYSSQLVFHELSQLRDELQGHKKKVSDQPGFNMLMSQIKQLLKQVSTPIDEENEIEDGKQSRSKKQRRKDVTSPPTTIIEPNDKEEFGKNSSLLESNTTPHQNHVNIAKPLRTLIQVFTDTDMELDNETRGFITLIDSSLADVLLRNSPQYNQILDDIEAKLSSGLREEAES